ncbi:DUF2867 domain-containing protein [Shimia sp.]|uniref:DUF2867 domain-containing protein n=1 Tax=Shimia sp. TaxID=1954381 RepID=UPI003BAA6F3C
MLGAFTKVSAAQLPADSLLQSRVAEGDFLDCYRAKCALPARAAADEVTRFPDWAQVLVALRNKLVAPLGLKGPSDVEDAHAGADHVGIFPIEAQTDQEVIAGFNDHHLDFRVSIYSTGEHVYLSTWVHRHNLTGRLYLATIMPFHVLIIRDALRRVAG